MTGTSEHQNQLDLLCGVHTVRVQFHYSYNYAPHIEAHSDGWFRGEPKKTLAHTHSKWNYLEDYATGKSPKLPVKADRFIGMGASKWLANEWKTWWIDEN